MDNLIENYGHSPDQEWAWAFQEGFTSVKDIPILFIEDQQVPDDFYGENHD